MADRMGQAGCGVQGLHDAAPHGASQTHRRTAGSRWKKPQEAAEGLKLGAVKYFLDNFPWNRFGTVYESNAKGLRDNFFKIVNGNAKPAGYTYIIERFEHQETLYRITPWGLKLYIHLLAEEGSDKNILLQNIKTLFEAANYNRKCAVALRYKPTNRNLVKYEQIKLKLFDKEFDGKMDNEYIKLFKSIDRHFLHISILEYSLINKPLLKTFLGSDDPAIAESARLLVNSIENPRKFEFINKDGAAEEY
jgi:hypothetical protein